MKLTQISKICINLSLVNFCKHYRKASFNTIEYLIKTILK